MRKSSLCSLLFFMILQVDAQRTPGLYKGIFASPDYSYRRLGTQFPGSLRDEFEIPKLAFTAGLDLIYQLNERSAIQFGMQFSEKGDKTEEMQLTYAAPDPSAPVSVWIDYKERYLDIPFRYNYYFGTKARSFFVTGGISINLFFGEKHEMHLTYQDGRQETKSDLRHAGFHSINPQLQLGAGMDWTFEKTRLAIFPILRYSVLPVNKGPLNGYFYSAGLGCSFMLNPTPGDKAGFR